MVIIAGVDEAGRGPLAGPVVAAAVILPNFYNLEGLDDSKKVTPKKRSQLFVEIQHQATSIGVGFVAAADIDKTNILQATQQAMKMALGRLKPRPDQAVIDGYALPTQNILLVSPWKPSLMTVTSIFRISPAFKTLPLLGIPWQITWFTEVQIDLGKPL